MSEGARGPDGKPIGDPDRARSGDPGAEDGAERRDRAGGGVATATGESDGAPEGGGAGVGAPGSVGRAGSGRERGGEPGTDAGRSGGLPTWLKGVLPLVGVAVLLALFLRSDPTAMLSEAFPPVEELTVERVTLPEPGRMVVHVVNGGPEAVTVAQVLVDDAAWAHSLDGERTIGRLERRSIEIPYPWVAEESHEVTLLTETGVTFSAEIEVAVQTPSPDARYLGIFALLGIYVGVIPVVLGLFWLPFLREIGPRWIDFFLSFTVGLLVFLGFDALVEAVEVSEAVPGAFQGTGLVVLGFLGAVLGLSAVGGLRRDRAGRLSPLHLAFLVALGIGLHNFGEGLVIGTAYATGEIALGAFLVIGFLLHNTTEGLAIVSPLARSRPGILRLAGLGALAGVPTILGAWTGGFTYSPTWTALFFAVGAGAVAQVVLELWRHFTARHEQPLSRPSIALGVLAGMLVMYVTGVYVTA